MEKVAKILESTDLTWFTELIKGHSLKRYVVAFTHNHLRSIELLESQIDQYSKSYDNITIGWRTDHHWEVFIDIWTTTDSLIEARRLQKRYNQLAIRDSVAGREL